MSTDSFCFQDIPTPELPDGVTRIFAVIFPNYSNCDAARIDGLAAVATGHRVINRRGVTIGRIEHAHRSDDAGRPIVAATFILDDNYCGGQVRIIDDEPISVMYFDPARNKTQTVKNP